MRDTVRLNWQGHATIEIAQLLLLQAAQIEILLPQDYNDILTQAILPLNGAGKHEIGDLEGGPELLEDISELDGLGELSELVDWLVELDATVHIFAPPAVLILVPRERTLH
jgi:hypothetical protein